MQNELNMKGIAKKHEERLEIVYGERGDVWAETKAGYKFESTDAHTAHEFTQADMKKEFKTIVPCDCEQCENSKDEGTDEDMNKQAIIDEAFEQFEADREAIKAQEEAEEFIEDHIEIIAVGNEAPTTSDNAIIEADDEEAPVKMWVGALGAYNSGFLVGDWIELPMYHEDISNEIKTILERAERITGEPQEEFEIMDLETPVKGLGYKLSFESIDNINEFAEQLADMDEDDIANLEAVNEVQGDILEAFDSIEDAIILDDVSTDEELAETLHEMDMLHIEIPSHLENYIDFESIGRDYRLGGDWYLTDTGKAVSLP